MSTSKSKPLASLYWSLIATTVLAALLVIATFWLAARSESENQWVHHSLAVRSQLNHILILVQSAESNARGYLLTRNSVYLKNYETPTSQLPSAIEKAATLTSRNPRQQRLIAQMRLLVAQKLTQLHDLVGMEKFTQPPASFGSEIDAEMKADQGFRNLVSQMMAEEDRRLSLLQNNAAASDTLLRTGAGASFLLICIVGLLVGFVTNRSFRELATARDQLLNSNRELMQQINLRETAEAQLRQAQKMEAIGQLTGGIAHDFNNMLGVISGSLDLIARRLKKGNYDIGYFVEAASKASDRAAALTHRLLAFARQQPLAPEPLDANKMIVNMSDLLRSTLGEHIEIETVSAAGLWRTKADAPQLENAILNIAINARDAMEDGGKLTIETGNAYLDAAYCRQHGELTPGQFVMVAITDTGSGMPPEIIARVFDPFFTTKPTGIGTGLGLSQVYGFVKQSRGHIQIYSEPDTGTTVKIYLPRFAGDGEESKDALPQKIELGSAGEVILITEDDPLMRQLTADALRELGYSVIDCEKASDALDILARRPDVRLLFTDVVMPEVNGKKLADEAVRRHPGLKVLFTTGYTPNAVVHGGVLSQGVQLLAKPFTLEQLATKIRSILDS
ncbi:MAG: response regulator [Beijerinckiaceae bacterium]|nr:MAG: response regulator [Beijerinckiaceae bacterium]